MSFGGPNYPMASLYVGDLHSSINEAMLFEKFSTAGQVLSVRVCRNANTQESMGYAYVNFQRPADAARALDTMNFDFVNGRPIRIMWSQRDPSLRKSNASNLFIKNLERSIDNHALYDTFSAFGKICSCKVALDDNGNSKGYGFVHFETEADAEKAINTVNGMLLNGKKVYVGKFIPRAERETMLGNRANLYTNVYVNNFDRNFTDDQLCAIFAEYGAITSHTIMKDENGNSRGFGFVAFEKPEYAAAAVEALNGKELTPGLPLYVGRAQSKRERQLELRQKFEALAKKYEDVNLYVKNLDEAIDDEGLTRLFSPFGTITSAVVMKEEGRSRGFGFVCFSQPSEATKAVAEMNGKMLTTKPLYVGLAQRKEERRTLLCSQFQQRVANTRMQQIGQTSDYYLHPAIATPQMYPTPGPSRVSQYNMYYNMPRNVPNGVVPHQQPADSPLTASILASAPPHQQKQILGERLYPLIQKVHPKLVGKITGMILEIDNAEILHMLEDNEALQTKIREALSALKLYQVPS